LKDTLNKMVDNLSTFGDEVTRVAREVGTDGKLGGQAEVPGVAGTWKDLTDNVNRMAANLTSQVRNIAEVATAVATGNLTKKITVEASGEILQLKDTLNKMVDNLSTFGDEVTRVAREVGTEGKLGGQAEVPGVAGTWKDLTENVNRMAANLTSQVRNIAEVSTAVANGDLTKKIVVEAQGEIQELKDTLNKMVDNLSTFGDEVTRVAKEVGTEGKLGGQGEVPGVSGTWKDLTDNVNNMAANLTSQVRNIAEVTTAVANGDLTKKIMVDARGEIQELKNTINSMVDNLFIFASEVTRVSREVGSEGKLGGQAKVPAVAGTWLELTDNVNTMAANLTSQVRSIGEVATAVANGDLTKKITVEAKGEIQELKDTINSMVDNLSTFADEVTRVSKEVGTEGKLGGQAQVPGVAGTWLELTENVNRMASNLTSQVRNIAEVATAVADGNLTKKITVEAQGEILELKNTLNNMVDNLNTFANEVTKLAREVGTEGKLGGEAQVPDVAGTWLELTENVNIMAANLTSQVREISKVVTAISKGDLQQKISIEAKGEVAVLTDTINSMVDDLNMLANEVSRVARVAGVEGKLTERAELPGVAGSWKNVVDTLNFLIESIATPVLEISRVVTAISENDISQKFELETAGDIKIMTDNLNKSLDNLNALIKQARDASIMVASVSQNVATSGEQMNKTTSDVATSISQMAIGSQTQAEKITEAVKSVEEISKAASEVATKADTVNETAKTMSKTAGIGIEIGEGTVKDMDTIFDAASKATTTVESLMQRSEEIGETLGVITDIAAQTNMLALNAAIVAARAGEAGKGFAVVAEEVRNLAEGSRKSAGEIAEVIKAVQEDTKEAVTSMKTMSDNVAKGKDSVVNAANAFKDIDIATREALETAQAISVASGKQKTSVDPVVTAVEEVSSIAEQTSIGAQESSAFAQELTTSMQELTSSALELSTMSGDLQESIAAFKLIGEERPGMGTIAKQIPEKSKYEVPNKSTITKNVPSKKTSNNNKNGKTKNKSKK